MTENPAVTVGMLMPADMGGAISRMLRAHGARVVTNLAGRSARTQALAAQAGAEDLGDDGALVAASDVILSVIAPGGARALAERMAPAIRAADDPPPYVDCNAVAPATTHTIAEIVAGAGGDFVDAGIIGLPPRQDPTETRVYLSGPRAAEVAGLLGAGVCTRLVSERIGDASAVKMCYAALTKGTTSIMTQLIVAAERLGVLDALASEFSQGQAEQFARLRHAVPSSIPKAFRWVAEMEEIARTFSDAGLTGKSFQGAAETYAAVAGTSLGKMRVEDWAARAPSFVDVVRGLAEEMKPPPDKPTGGAGG